MNVSYIFRNLCSHLWISIFRNAAISRLHLGISRMLWGPSLLTDWSFYSTRQSTQLNLFQCRISAAERAFRFRASNWNSLSNETRNSASFEAGFLSLSVELGFWIPIFSRILDSLSSRVQSSGFQIPQAQFSRIPESRFPCMGRPLSICMWQQPILTRTALRLIWHSYTKSPTQ